LEAYQQAVQEEIREVFSSHRGFLYDLLRYQLGWTDQRGAPEDNPAPLHFPSTLALVSCEALSGDFRPSLPAAAGIELVHNFILVHGDVQSSRVEAQERPSIWWLWGPSQAINAGDGLHALGRTTIMRLAQRGVTAERVLRAVESLDRACLALCEGQCLDLDFQDQLVVTVGAYYDMIARKTGALAGCSAESGVLAAGADEAVSSKFREAGSRLGMAWQISRDIAELWGQSRRVGTPSSVLHKKKSLPLIYALDNASVAVKRELGAIYMKRVLQPEDASRVIEILEQAGARRFAEGKAAEMVEEAMALIEGVELPPERLEDLRNLGRLALQGGP
jgi:geranylgeranyl diphosphate synthase type I